MRIYNAIILSLFTLSLTALGALAAEDDKDLVELDPMPPKAIAKGTEVPKNIPNLEKARKKNTDPARIKIPKGCSNLAFEKDEILSSKDVTDGDLEDITDGDATGAAKSVVNIKDGLAYVDIDLEDSHSIYAIQLWHYHSTARVYKDVIIQISDDEDFAEGVTTVFNNDHDNSANLGKGSDKNYIEEYHGKTIKVDGVKGQYVRFYSNGYYKGKGNHYCEIRIHGK